MQDIHVIGGGGGRFFSGGVADRRLRSPHHHQNHPAVKCPRCDSINTKFCYYNNYNLSQPRHFCKSCRRYWTKGGVLRNVPVGGGCRKTKRPNPPKRTPSSSSADAASASNAPPQREMKSSSSQSHSSSESSSLTAANAAGDTTVEAVPAHSSSSVSNNNLINSIVGESQPFGDPITNPNFESGLLEQAGSDCGIFSEIGSITSLVTSSHENLSFGFNNILNLQSHSQLWPPPPPPPQKVAGMGGDEVKKQEMAGGLLIDQTVQSELSALENNNKLGNDGGYGPLDWHGSGDQELIDLPNAVDQAYWSHCQWGTTDHDHPSLYLP